MFRMVMTNDTWPVTGLWLLGISSFPMIASYLDSSRGVTMMSNVVDPVHPRISVARTVIDELDPADRVVIRALPSSRHTISARLEQELRTALRRTRPRSRARK